MREEIEAWITRLGEERGSGKTEAVEFLAEKAGVGASTIRNFLAGMAFGRYYTAKRLADTIRDLGGPVVTPEDLCKR